MHPLLTAYINLLVDGTPMPTADRVAFINRVLFTGLITQFESIRQRGMQGSELRAALEAAVKPAAASTARSALYCARAFEQELQRSPQERPFAAYGSVTIKRLDDGTWTATPDCFTQHVGLPATYQAASLSDVIQVMEHHFRTADLLPLTPA